MSKDVTSTFYVSDLSEGKLIRNCVNCGRPITRNFKDICYFCETRHKLYK